MTPRFLQTPLRERLKLAVRTRLMRHDLDVVGDPWSRRVVRMMRAQGIDTVVDVGANVGQFGALLRHAGFAGRIISVEPLSLAFDRLHARASDDELWITQRAAVGTESWVTLHVSQNWYSSSVLDLNQEHLRAAPDSRVVADERVPVVAVDDLVAQHGLDPGRTLLKIDTQGYEDHVLDSAERTLDSMRAVQLELSLVELYVGQTLMPKLHSRLESSGLAFYAAEAGIADRHGRMLQFDGLYVREEGTAVDRRNE